MRRFWEKVEIAGPDECWYWSAAQFASGYGVFGLDGKSQRAHRVAFALTNGPIPQGLCVLHSCDSPPCVNPNHLFLGTHAENMADRDAKGRGNPPVGERAQAAKLTSADVVAIRSSSKKGVDLAVIYGVSKATICDIRREKSWKHLL